jgi:hypothetical protein
VDQYPLTKLALYLGVFYELVVFIASHPLLLHERHLRHLGGLFPSYFGYWLTVTNCSSKD